MYQYQYINRVEQYNYINYDLIIFDSEQILPELRVSVSFPIAGPELTEQYLSDVATYQIQLIEQGHIFKENN